MTVYSYGLLTIASSLCMLIIFVKKFKLLIMKMTKKDLLPKGQAKELLMELATLGY